LLIFDERGARRNFADWVRAALANPNHYDCKEWGGEVSEGIHRWSPQTDWISINGRVAVDFVARLENLQPDFEQVCQRLGLARVVLPHKNRKLHWHYAQYYDAETRRIVGDYYAADIEAFGYRFEGGSAMGRISKRIADRLWRFWDSRTAPQSAEPADASPSRITDR
jgi:hypothetical protein